MDNVTLKIITALAICFSLYSFISPDSPKLYSQQQLSAHYVNKSFKLKTASLLYKSQLEQCNYDYYKRSQQWQNCIKEGMNQIRENTLAQIKADNQ